MRAVFFWSRDDKGLCSSQGGWFTEVAYGCVEDVWNGVVGVAVNCNEGDSDGVCKKCALPSISCAVTETAASADKTMEDQILHCVIAFILH